MHKIAEYYVSSSSNPLFDELPHLPFVNAVRDYGRESEANRRVQLLESLIWTSRSGRADDRALPEDVHQTLCSIRARYQLYSPMQGTADPATYRTARLMILDLFF